MLGVKSLGRALIGFCIRTGVSQFVLAKFREQTSGFLALETVIDQAAEHSQWLNRNRNLILAISGVGLSAFQKMGADGKIAPQSRLLNVDGKLFSRSQIGDQDQNALRYRKALKVEALTNGCKISYKGQSITLYADESGINYKNEFGDIGAALLASGFGLVGGKIDWQSTAESLALTVSKLMTVHGQALISHKVSTTSPSSLFRNASNIVRTLRNESEFIDEEYVWAEVMRSLGTKETQVSDVRIDYYVDVDGEFIIELNGLGFTRDGDFLVRCIPGQRSSAPVEEDDHAVVSSLMVFIRALDDNGFIDFARVPRTARFVTQPVTAGDVAIALLWDAETKQMKIVVAESSLIDSAAKNVTDVTDASIYESGVAFLSSAYEAIETAASKTVSFFKSSEEVEKQLEEGEILHLPSSFSALTMSDVLARMRMEEIDGKS